ncbi:hypothetical protein J2T60_000554 [Natronospira proteinivora]|uniref:Uncharacterized protein n=1 Tax=Natronospira proteinivora TaxID=1807133 RepID=A0ABT1G5K5_9GAMM|nr:hypothetical protein [Natronospira proteinivora]MCP1726589.1 hypothetical protein [Natronospira proteinivora]
MDMPVDIYRHTLSIGGTGMLRFASLKLASCSARFTSVARTRSSLSRLDDALGNCSTRHHQLQLNWSHSDDFLAQIEKHASNTELPDLVVAWIHDDQLTLRLAQNLAEMGMVSYFFHIIGSATVNPEKIAGTLLDAFDPPPNLAYHQVILGAQDTGYRSRWLTDQEISEGVLEAIRRMDAQFVVGTLDRYK